MNQRNQFCSACGQPLEANAQFCRVCGAAVQQQRQPQPTYQQEQPQYPQDRPYYQQNQPQDRPYYPQDQPQYGQPLMAPMAMSDKNARNYALFCHLASFANWFLPFAGIIVGLIIWNDKRRQSAFVDMHGKEALNAQLSYMIYAVVSGIMIFFFIGFPMLLLVGLLQVITTIIGAVRASNGEQYQYPLSIRFIK